MLDVAIGSSADAGSSSRITSGSTASARAMHRRCCWPPESASALRFSRPFTSSHSAACVEILAQAEHPRTPGDVVVDRLRERVRFLLYLDYPAPHRDRVDTRAVE